MDKANSGCCFSKSICSHHTPRGLVASLAKRRMFSFVEMVLVESIAILSIKFCAMIDLTESQAISLMPK